MYSMVPGSDPQPGIKPGPHWWEADALTTRPPEHPLRVATLRGQIVLNFWRPFEKAATSFFSGGGGRVTFLKGGLFGIHNISSSY